MSARLSPQLARAYQILSDGEWHEREAVLREMYKAIPPGQAARAAEKVRQQSGPSEAPPERVIGRSMEFLINTGRRHLARSSLRSANRVETEDRDGVTYVRLRDPLPYAPRAVDRPPLTSDVPPRRPPRTAGERRTAYTLAAYEALADGKWHDWSDVVAIMARAIPEDDARVIMEYKRTWPYRRRGEEPPPRKRALSDKKLVAAGRRTIAVEALANNRRIVRREVDGTRQVMLRPPEPTGAAARKVRLAAAGQMELGGGI